MKATYKVITDRINVNKFGDTITLWFFGDVHRDTKNCDIDRWQYFLETAKKTMDDNTYFIGMGDYHDFASTREKKYLQTELHESTSNLLDEIAEKHNRDLASELSFMRGRLLGLVEGNHSWNFQTGKTSTEDLAERLDTKDLGWLCHYSVIFDFGNRGGTSALQSILCHGKAGGKTLGITVNQIGDLKSLFPLADIYMMGHDHQRIAHPTSVLYAEYGNKDKIYYVKQKRQYLCRSGCFQRAYRDGSNSYEIFRLYRPNDIGALKLKISHHRDYKNDNDRVITDIVAEI